MTTNAMEGTNDYNKIRERSIEQCDRPTSITRKEAEKICRSVISKQKGSVDIAPNLFEDAVNQLMEEINGAEVSDAT
jgi:hypothetical protein